MIKLQIVGNLGKDCIVNEVNGRKVINFSVAHTEKYKDSTGTPKERTTWVECAYWTDKTAIAQYLTKGKMVYAEGAPDADPYTKKDGQPGATLRMRVQTIQLLGGGSSDQSNTGSYANQSNMTGSSAAVAAPAMSDTDDSLPF